MSSKAKTYKNGSMEVLFIEITATGRNLQIFPFKLQQASY
jgi:hypothetical protein